MEINCRGFEVVREYRGKSEIIGWRDGSASSVVRRDYQLDDLEAEPNEFYIYSLVQYDFHMPGKTIASKPLHTSRQPVLVSELYPNPAAGEIFLSIDTVSKLELTITVHNNLGQQVHQERFRAPSGLTRWRLDCSTMKEGFYTLRMSWDGGELLKHFFKMQ